MDGKLSKGRAMAASKESPVPGHRTGPRNSMAVLANRLTGLSDRTGVVKYEYEQVERLWTVSIDHNYACLHGQKGREKINRLTDLQATGGSKNDAGKNFLSLPKVQEVWTELAAEPSRRDRRKDEWEAEKATQGKQLWEEIFSVF